MTGPIIVCELSANHNGSLERALQLVEACAAAGADAVKLQAWTAGTMVIDADYVPRDGPWAGRNLAELYEQARTPWEWWLPIFQRAHALGIEAFASVFDLRALAILDRLGCPRYKVASFEIVDLPLIKAIAQTGKPVILSTGMASREEIARAVFTAQAAGCKDLTLLRCTSAYPATAAHANLVSMRAYTANWGVKAGVSDHTLGIGVAIAAAAMGAIMIEKHVTLSRADGGLDAAFSIEPNELAQLVSETRNAAEAVGAVSYGFGEHERPQVALRRSLYFARELPTGAVISEADLCTARPAEGLAPRYAAGLVGCSVRAPVRRGQPVTWEVIAVHNIVLPTPVPQS